MKVCCRTVEVDLITWVDIERTKRGWSLRELSRCSGFSDGYMQLVMSGQRNITYAVCSGLARAFGVPPDQVFRLAGLLPKISPQDNLAITKLIEMIQYLSPQRIQTLSEIASGLYEAEIAEATAKEASVAV